MSDTDEMDVPEVLERLEKAVTLQYRSALQFTVLAGSVTGLAHQYMSSELWNFAERELEDARRLIEKMTALGGVAPTEVPPIKSEQDFPSAVGWLIRAETEAVEALGAVIPPSGQEGRSEALEHLMEHIILRKQDQIDLLIRSVGGPGGS